MTSLMTNGLLIGLLVILCVSANRRAKKQDEQLIDYYSGHIESLLHDSAVDDDILFGVLDRVARFGEEVDQEMQRMEVRLQAQERRATQLATELEDMKRLVESRVA